MPGPDSARSWYDQENFGWLGLTAMSPFLTSKENIVVNLIYEWLGESRINRTFDKYMEIALRFPKVEACYAYVNRAASRNGGCRKCSFRNLLL